MAEIFDNDSYEIKNETYHEGVEFSVIIAAYNADATVERCIQSIAAAKKAHTIELIIINDGSIDRTAEVLDRWAQRTPWITLRHQENAGVAVARNVGLEIASGAYISFIDADDTVDDEYFDFLVEKAVRPGIDMLVFGYKRILLNGSVVEQKNAHSNYTLEDLQQLQLRVTENRNLYWLICTRVFKREAIGELRFDKGIRLGGDVIFIIKCLSRASYMSVVPDTPYNYYENASSLTSAAFKPALLESVEAHYKARLRSHEWPEDSSDKDVLLADFSRSYVEHMLPYIVNNLRYTSFTQRRKELIRIRQSFLYQECLPNYAHRHPSRSIRWMIENFSRRRYMTTLALLHLSWWKAALRKSR